MRIQFTQFSRVQLWISFKLALHNMHIWNENDLWNSGTKCKVETKVNKLVNDVYFVLFFFSSSQSFPQMPSWLSFSNLNHEMCAHKWQSINAPLFNSIRARFADAPLICCWLICCQIWNRTLFVDNYIWIHNCVLLDGIRRGWEKHIVDRGTINKRLRLSYI